MISSPMRAAVSTQRNLLMLQGGKRSDVWRLHVQRLVRASVVIELDPIADGTACVGQALEPLAMDALLLQ